MLRSSEQACAAQSQDLERLLLSSASAPSPHVSRTRARLPDGPSVTASSASSTTDGCGSPAAEELRTGWAEQSWAGLSWAGLNGAELLSGAGLGRTGLI